MDLYFQKVFVHEIPWVNIISIKSEVKAKVHKNKSSNKIKDERFISLNVPNLPFFGHTEKCFVYCKANSKFKLIYLKYSKIGSI